MERDLKAGGRELTDESGEASVGAPNDHGGSHARDKEPRTGV